MSVVISADGTVIDFDRYGAGRPVVCVGGAGECRGLTERTLQSARLLAAEGFATVDFDRRGRGRSGDTPSWALEREVEDLAALVAAVGGRTSVYTSSSGAAGSLARLAEQRVDRSLFRAASTQHAEPIPVRVRVPNY